MRSRTIDFKGGPRVGLVGSNGSVHYARHWLESIGLETAALDDFPSCPVVVCAGLIDTETGADSTGQLDGSGRTLVVLWDFQVGMPGTGLDASAASGASWVIGRADAPPLALPVELPEKWCGLIGANLAISGLLDVDIRGPGATRRFDVSAADALRSFADQNAGNHVEVEHGWRRNGSLAVEHGGIYPQGFFPCRDGHVAMVGRSRKDWAAIRDVIGRPAWTNEPRFDDPFELAADSAEADELLSEALMMFDRDDLLERSIASGATLAPVYKADELDSRGIVRSGFFSDTGTAGLPFEVVAREPATP